MAPLSTNKETKVSGSFKIILVVLVLALLVLFSFYQKTVQTLTETQAEVTRITTAQETIEAVAFDAQNTFATQEAEMLLDLTSKEQALATVNSQLDVSNLNSEQAINAVATRTAEIEILQQQMTQMRARELAAYAQLELTTHPQKSLLLAIEAFQTYPFASAETFFQALTNISGLGLPAHLNDVTDMVVSSDSRWLATSSQDQTIHLWDLSKHNPGEGDLVLTGHSRWVTALDISPDNHWLASASEDGTVRIWDLTSSNPATQPIVLQEYEYGAKAVKFSPDNQWFIIGSSYKIHLRKWTNLALDPIELSSSSSMEQLVVTPDSHWLFANNESTILRWDLTATDISASGISLSMPFNPDRSGQRIFPRPLSVSPNGQWLASGMYDGVNTGAVLLWNLEQLNPTSLPITLVGKLDSSISAVAFSPDSQRLAAAHFWGDHAIYVWDLTLPQPQPDPLVLEPGGGYVGDLDFSPDSQWLVSGTADQIVRVWPLNIESRSIPIVLKGFENAVGHVRFSPDNHWLIAAHENPWEPATENSIRLWRWDSSPHYIGIPLALPYRDNWITNMLVSPDNRWLVVLDQHICDGEDCEPNGDATATLWALATEGPQAQPIVLFEDEPWINTVAISDDGRWLAMGGEGLEIWLWDLTSLDPAQSYQKLQGHESQINDLRFTPDGRWLVSASGRSWNSATSDNTVRLWNLMTPDSSPQPIVLEGHADTAVRLMISADGNWLYTLSDEGRILLWDLTRIETNRNALEVDLSQGDISYAPHSFVISPDRHWLVTYTEGANASLQLYDLTNIEPATTVKTLMTFREVVVNGWLDAPQLFFSADNQWLIMGQTPFTTKPRLWDLMAPNPSTNLQILNCGDDEFVSLSPDHHWIVTSDHAEKTCLWDISQPEQQIIPIQLSAHSGAARSAIFSPDSQRLAISNADNLIHIWDLRGADPNTTTLTLPQKEVRVMAFSLDGRWLVVDSQHSGLYLWPLQSNELITLACFMVGRNLTQAEWNQYFAEEPYRPTCGNFP